MEDDFGKLIEPAPVKFAFTEPGWYVLGCLLLLSLLIIAWLWLRHYRKNQYRRDALEYLSALQQECMTRDGGTIGQDTGTPAQDGRTSGNSVQDGRHLVYETSMLLKRVVISKYGRIPFAGNRGEEWIASLNDTWKKRAFDSGDAALLQTIYEPPAVPADISDAYVEKARLWIKKHRYALRNSS